MLKCSLVESQHIKVISKGSWDTEDCGIDAENVALQSQ